MLNVRERRAAEAKREAIELIDLYGENRTAAEVAPSVKF
jgi:hypothetical protein